MTKKTRQLNRAAVVKTAARLVDQHGSLQDLTLAELAAELKIRTPSLYNHISGSQDLQQALAVWTAERLLEEMQAAIFGIVGREALQASARAYRDFARQHPGLYPLLMRAPSKDEPELQAVSNQLVQLVLLQVGSYGLSGKAALHAVRAFRSLVHGFASLEIAGGFGLDLSCEASFEIMLDTFLAGLEQSAPFSAQRPGTGSDV